MNQRTIIMRRENIFPHGWKDGMGVAGKKINININVNI